MTMCYMEYNFTNMPTTRGNIYQTFAWMEGIDPTGGLLAGDTAFGCFIMDGNNLADSLGLPYCYGSSSYGATLDFVDID